MNSNQFKSGTMFKMNALMNSDNSYVMCPESDWYIVLNEIETTINNLEHKIYNVLDTSNGTIDIWQIDSSFVREGRCEFL